MAAVNRDGVTSSLLTADEPSRANGVEALPLLLLSAALDDPETGHVIFDAQLRLLHVTNHTAQLLEFSTREARGDASVLDLLSRSALDKSSIEQAASVIQGFRSDSQPTSVLLRNQDRSRYLRMRLRSIGQDYRVASFEGAAAEEESVPQVSEVAQRDSLTGLVSRQYFEETLSQALARRPDEPVTLFQMDLDRFKAVNDTLGHAAGDSLLRLASERLKAAVRKEDIVARLGGDEFAVLMHPALPDGEAISIANRILDLVQRTYMIEGQLVNVGTSVGIAQAPKDGRNAAQLLRSADLALYHSKQSGRATFHFFEEHMERRAQARRTSELELRRALALRQLEVFYQPQIDTKHNRLVGFEALLRWRHPERGMIPPGDFFCQLRKRSG